MRAKEIPSLSLDSYQRAARVVLANHLVTQTYPERLALPLVRRWATELREDVLELFGYRLEVTETTARLFTVADHLDPETPAKSASERTFDRCRYAYLALSLAALGRAGNQITLSELADHVAASAAQVPGIELSTERAGDRDAFVDAVGWLATRGAIALTDGDAGGWAANPESGEALYDIDRAVVVALFRPAQPLQHLRSVRGLLAESPVDVKATQRRVRRALVTQPVVYAAELDDDARVQLALPRTTLDLELLTGLVTERRAEGVAMIDTSGRLSDTRFPGTGTVSQVALLLAGEIADRVMDPDAPELTHLPFAASSAAALVGELDTSIPHSGIFEELADDAPEESEITVSTASDDTSTFPLVQHSWVNEIVHGLVDRFGKTFAAAWQADPEGLEKAATGLLERLDLVETAPGGFLVLPALARYRGVVVTIRERTPEIDLFQSTSEDTTA